MYYFPDITGFDLRHVCHASVDDLVDEMGWLIDLTVGITEFNQLFPGRPLFCFCNF